MAVAALAGILKDAIGLDAESIGQQALERAIQDRLAGCGLTDVAAYCARVRGSKDELQALIESVVVPETWFFRDPGAFDALSALVRHGTVPIGPEPLRLLSVPSSTGEEPYSMVMALLDAGVPPGRFQVEAIDVSLHALERAAAAAYGRNSFRGAGPIGRDHHFEDAPEGRRVTARVRGQVRFQRGNVLASPFVVGADAFDIIFCRNLLIYFDRPTQDRALAALGALLKPHGLLFVGSSEGGLALGHGFVSAKLPMAFAFRRGARVERWSRPHASLPRRDAPPAARSRAPRPPVPPPSEAAPAGLTAAALDDARRLADQGRFAEAAERCRAHVHEHGPSATAFSLLGLVEDASGRADEAAACYRKALYLDPANEEAVTHLALLVERQGHADEAKVLWARARRLAKGADAAADLKADA